MTIRQMLNERSGLTIFEDLKIDFAERLYAILETKGVNQSELARLMGVNRSFVSRIIKAKSNLTFATIAKISNALNVDMMLTIGSKGEKV